jgi:hypothetical protein
MQTMTSTATAILSKYGNLNEDGMPDHAADLIFLRQSSDLGTWTNDGYTVIGTAEITVTVFDKETIIANKIDAMRSEIVSIKADAYQKVVKIEGRIQDLLAIGFSAPVTPIDDDGSIPF